MLAFLQVVTVMLVALAAGLALAHALELPGKLLLDKASYYAIQPIYYPGFTIGGAVGELGGIVATVLLAVVTPAGTLDFWLVLAALAGLLAMHAIYWTVTHPVNNFWVAGKTMNAAGAAFFGFGSRREGWNPEWTELRDRWEYSHVARAVVAGVSLLALVMSLVV